jgi:hypothetical protein
MNRRGLMGMIAALALAAFMGVSANAADTKLKAKAEGACCGKTGKRERPAPGEAAPPRFYRFGGALIHHFERSSWFAMKGKRGSEATGKAEGNGGESRKASP